MIKEISIVFKMIFVLLLLHVNSTAATLQNGPPIVPIVPPQNPVAGGPNQGPGQHYDSFRCWAILYCLVMMIISSFSRTITPDTRFLTLPAGSTFVIHTYYY